jgi:hypothetical protein
MDGDTTEVSFRQIVISYLEIIIDSLSIYLIFQLGKTLMICLSEFLKGVEKQMFNLNLFKLKATGN